MSDFSAGIEVIAEQAGSGLKANYCLEGEIRCAATEELEESARVEELVTHPDESRLRANPAPVSRPTAEAGQEEELCGSTEQRLYRKRATTMLRRYMRYSMETGRLPSILGREFFRSRVTRYRVTTLEERVIFVLDMEKCLERLDDWSRQVLARVVLQEYEHEEAARLLGCARITVHRKLVEALDKLTEILLEVGLLEPVIVACGNPCQERDEGYFELSDRQQSKNKIEKHDTRTYAI
jgi:hypothetical protein